MSPVVLAVEAMEGGEMGKVTEIRCTCQSCKGTYHYGAADELQACFGNMSNAGRSMMCCSGCAPAAALKKEQIRDLNQCPFCGSRNVTKVKVVHNV